MSVTTTLPADPPIAAAAVRVAPGAAKTCDNAIAPGGGEVMACPAARDLEYLIASQERWRDKAGVAEHFSCSIRWIESRMGEGLPHTFIAGRAKFRISEIEPWLDANGFIERAGVRK